MDTKLYLDLDGVLADFDAGAHRALGECHYRYDFIHGSAALWERLNAADDFFANLPAMPGAPRLWFEVKHRNPIILTALPRSNPDDVDRQKRDWVRRHLGKSVEVITCRTKDKPRYAAPGDVLVDDRTINRANWKQAGGRFVHHRSVHETILRLRAMGVV